MCKKQFYIEYVFYSSTGLTFDNDDSGFSEPQRPTNNRLDDTKTASRNSSTESNCVDHRLVLTDTNLIADGAPVPRSSSTPNRVEIFINEKWIEDRDDIENEPYDLNLKWQRN